MTTRRIRKALSAAVLTQYNVVLPPGVPYYDPDDGRLLNGPALPDRVTDHPTDPAWEVWEWDADLSAEDTAALDRAIRVVRDMMTTPTDADLQPHIDVLRQWRNRTGTPTDAQRDRVLDAMMDLWRLTLKDDPEPEQ